MNISAVKEKIKYETTYDYINRIVYSYSNDILLFNIHKVYELADKNIISFLVIIKIKDKKAKFGILITIDYSDFHSHIYENINELKVNRDNRWKISSIQKIHEIIEKMPI